MPEPILKITGLEKTYDGFSAVRGISFEIKPGEIVGLLGPNGAGKTTTINMILGILTPSAGAITVTGIDARRRRSEIDKIMNFAAVYASLPGNLTIWQNLYIFGLLYGVADLKNRIAAILADYDLARFKDLNSGVLSSGEQSRMNLAKALMNEPRLLLLDEPTASLDPSTSAYIRERIKTYVRERRAGVLWTSHNMQEIERVCDRVLFLSQGRILLEGKPGELPAAHNKKDLEELFISLAREPLDPDKGSVL